MSVKHKNCEVQITGLRYPNVGTGTVDGLNVGIKNTLPGQTVEAVLTKKKGRYLGRRLRVVNKAPYEIEPLCPDFGSCGGCSYQNISYAEELRLKEQLVRSLFIEAGFGGINFLGIRGAKNIEGYRNKMEFSFGDESKGGRMTLGIRKRDSFYEVVTPKSCNIIDSDLKKILLAALDYFSASGETFLHRVTKRGALRHLIVRKAYFSSELLVNLVTTSEFASDLNGLDAVFKSLPLDGRIAGFLHTVNDSVSDAIYCDSLTLVSGRDYFVEKLLGLSFIISPFSFFQTNSAGAEELYAYVAGLVEGIRPHKVFDLYCGTGTIAQIISKYAESVIGIEIVAEAVEAAALNAEQNGIRNCTFITGDVLKTVDEQIVAGLSPELIILDPPRDGLHPKALKKVIDFSAGHVIYISCKPTSLVRDLAIFYEGGYEVQSAVCFDMFPRTWHVETVVLMSKNHTL